MAILNCGEARAQGIEILDDLGRRVVLDAPAKRIIALYGAYNEIIAAMGMEKTLVGRTKADTVPPSLLSRPSIGTHMRPNVEMIIGLRPDLVIQSAGRKDALLPVRQLADQGIQVAVFQPDRFEELFSVIERIGLLAGNRNGASALNQGLEKRLRAVQERVGGIAHRPSVFFEVRYPNLLAAGRGSIVSDIITKAGGLNCVESEKKLVRMNMEALIGMDPEIYIVQVGPMNQNPSAPSDRDHFHVLRAVKDNRVMMVDEQAYSRPGPRSVEAVEELAAFLHPRQEKNRFRLFSRSR